MNQEDARAQARHATVLDDTARHVARVYAEALLKAAEKRGQAEAVLDELHGLTGDVFARDPQFELFLSSAAVARDRKDEVLLRTLEGRVSDTLLGGLRVLNQHGRLDLLRAVAGLYGELYDRRHDRTRVDVRSAVPLTDDQLGRLRGELADVLGKEPLVHSRVDPELLGGLVVQVEDWVYDASVRGRLRDIRKHLIERSSHAIQGGRDRFGY
jgi:F-type H+-transporting ATPase subunit delta